MKKYEKVSRPGFEPTTPLTPDRRPDGVFIVLLLALENYGFFPLAPKCAKQSVRHYMD